MVCGMIWCMVRAFATAPLRYDQSRARAQGAAPRLVSSSGFVRRAATHRPLCSPVFFPFSVFPSLSSSIQAVWREERQRGRVCATVAAWEAAGGEALMSGRLVGERGSVTVRSGERQSETLISGLGWTRFAVKNGEVRASGDSTLSLLLPLAHVSRFWLKRSSYNSRRTQKPIRTVFATLAKTHHGSSYTESCILHED